MNTAVIASIISVVGAGFIGVLIVFLQAIRADISDLRKDTSSGFASLRKDTESGLADLRKDTESGFAGLRKDTESSIADLRKDMTEVKESLARIESTQEAHGKQLALMADHDERIAAIESTLSAAS